jgi:hypothetical protein
VPALRVCLAGTIAASPSTLSDCPLSNAMMFSGNWLGLSGQQGTIYGAMIARKAACECTAILMWFLYLRECHKWTLEGACVRNKDYAAGSSRQQWRSNRSRWCVSRDRVSMERDENARICTDGIWIFLSSYAFPSVGETSYAVATG